MTTFVFYSSFCFPGSIFKRKHLRRFSQHCFKQLPATYRRRSHAGSTTLSTQSARHMGTELCQMPFLTNRNRKTALSRLQTMYLRYGWQSFSFATFVPVVLPVACSISCWRHYIMHMLWFSHVFPVSLSGVDRIIAALAGPNTCYSLANARYKLSNLQFPYVGPRKTALDAAC